MADNNQHPLPDISGVFNIDESRIPSKIIAKPEEPKKKEPGQSILLRPETREDSKKQEKMLKTVIRERKKKARKQQLRKRLIAAAAAMGVLLAVALVIYAGVQNKKKPVVKLVAPARETLVSYYETRGFKMYDTNTVIFIDNDYEEHGIESPNRTELVSSDGERTASGLIRDIRAMENDSEEIRELMDYLPDESYSTASNWVIFIDLDDDSQLNDEEIVDIRVENGRSKKDNALTLPSAAVFTRDGKDYVWVYSSVLLTKKVKLTEVTVGLRTEEKVEITGGIKEKNKIALPETVNGAELADGSKVRLEDE